jgi:hypothetical protein
MKTLLAFGCSNTRGAEAINDYDAGLDDDSVNKDYAYPKYIAELLGYEYHNFAINGVSNQQIASKIHETLNTISNIEDIFVLIGWTDDDRMAVVKNPVIDFRRAQKSDEVVTISHSHTVSCTKSYLGQLMTPAEIGHMKSVQNIPLEFIIGVAERIFLSKNFSDINFYIKYAMACFLRESRIPHLTLPTLYNHYNSLYNIFLTTNISKNNILQHDEDGKIAFNFIKKFKSYGIAKSGAHLKADAHRQAGIYLYNYIMDNKLIQ